MVLILSGSYNPPFMVGCYDSKNECMYANVVVLKPWKVCCFAPSVFDDLQEN